MEENEALRRQVSEKDATIASQKDEIAKLLDTLAYLRKKQFGQMSEKHLPLDPAQLTLFDQQQMTEEEKAALAQDVEKAEETITYSVTRKAKPSRKPLDDRREWEPQARVCRDWHRRVQNSRNGPCKCLYQEYDTP